MRALITTLFDALGLLLVAAGAAAAIFPIVGWACLAAAGIVLLIGSALSVWLEDHGS